MCALLHRWLVFIAGLFDSTQVVGLQIKPRSALFTTGVFFFAGLDQVAFEMEQPTKTNRPPNDDFRQQKLKAWQPIMTPWKVIVLFLAIGVAFVPTGTTLLSKSKDVRLFILLLSPPSLTYSTLS